MGRKIGAFAAVCVGVFLMGSALMPEGPIQTASARMMPADFGGGFRSVQAFGFLDVPLTTRDVTAKATDVTLSGGVMAVLDSKRFVVADEDSGTMVVTDGAGKKLGELKIRQGVGQLAVDRANSVVYVADRAGDRVWKVTVGDDSSVTHKKRVATPAEPFGLALTPDAKTLLVSTVADRTLVAFNTESMTEAWRVAIPAEARGVAVSPDGKEALVAHLTTGTLTHVDLKTRKLSHTALNRTNGSAAPQPIEVNGEELDEPTATNAQKAQVRINSSSRRRRHRGFGNRTAAAAPRFARNAFATTFLPNGVAVVAYQESTPQQISTGVEQVSTYGGGSDAPINHRVAFIAPKSETGRRDRRVARAEIALHQPRAIAYDQKNDRLYLAAIGNDQVVAIDRVSSPSAQLRWTQSVPAKEGLRCGATGIAVGADGDVRVFCSVSRRVAWLKENKTASNVTPVASLGDKLTKSRLSRAALLGKQLFHQGSDFRLSAQGAMACASCHPEGRTDGLSWRIEGNSLQTPLLTGGRLLGTHPFKWDGKDTDINSSLVNTVRRLGGNGITKSDVKNLKAFFAALPKPRTPTSSKKAVARGKKLFSSKSLGCNRCHSGTRYTNNESYDLADDLDEVDTPSLLGLAASAPYYHDGSAANLRALLNGKGDIHGMSGIDRVKSSQVNDLIAFLESL